MSITCNNTLIPYFTVYLLHNFYNLKTGGDRKNGFQNLTVHPKTLIKNIKKTIFKCENDS